MLEHLVLALLFGSGVPNQALVILIRYSGHDRVDERGVPHDLQVLAAN
jgi:hypothetical protein